MIKLFRLLSLFYLFLLQRAMSHKIGTLFIYFMMTSLKRFIVTTLRAARVFIDGPFLSR
jgi:prolipoprotein diacylglyceryltransferase